MRWLILTLVFCFTANSSWAASIQARLIRASLDGEQIDQRLEDIYPKLKKTFGYPRYHQLNRQQQAIEAGENYRIDLGDGFVIFVRPRSVKDERAKVEVEWFSGKAQLVKSTFVLKPDQFLFIKGPEVGNDWVILALTLVK